MRFKCRTAVAASVAVFALSAVVASAASAAPEFKPSTKQAFTGTSGALTIETSSTEPVTCSKVTSAGEITGASTVGSLVLTLTGCETKEGGDCSLTGEGLKTKGEIVTNALVGTLGEVKTTEATSGVGLLLEPASGTVWAKIQAPCFLGTEKLEGKLAVEVTPIKTLAKTGKLVSMGKEGNEKIKDIVVKGVKRTPNLELGLLKISWEATETLTFNGNEVEIT